MLSYVSSALLAATTFAAVGKDWNYDDLGRDWGTIHDGKYSLCDTGVEQSPIDLDPNASSSNNLKLHLTNYYNFVGTSAVDDPTYTTGFADEEKRAQANLEVTYWNKEKLEFTPKQFHFHAPSEHSVDEQLYDAEVHFVHVNKGSGTTAEDGTVSGETYGAVIGIFFDVDEDDTPNPFIQEVFDAFTATHDGDDDTSAKQIAVANFLESVDMTEFWEYDGSFTTPPCTEGIKWNVVKQVQPISKAQLDFFKSKLSGDADFANGNGNNRIVQDIEDRVLMQYGASGATSMVTYAAATMAAIATLFF